MESNSSRSAPTGFCIQSQEMDKRLYAVVARANLRFLYTNAQILVSKIDELKTIVSERIPDVIAITESWLNAEIVDSAISIAGYQVFRRDRQNRRGGGVVVYVRAGISTVERAHTLSLEYESVCIKIKKANAQNLEFLAIYRPPNLLSAADESLPV